MRHVFICHTIGDIRKSGNFLLLVEKDGRVLMSTNFCFYSRKSCPNKKLSKKMINSLSYTLTGDYRVDLNKSKISDCLMILFPTVYDEIRIIQNYEVG